MPSSKSTGPLAQFHALAGHAGPAHGCRKCTTQLRQQRSATAAFRSHRRQARQHVHTILRKAAR
jgi:hypothetical protein